MNNFYIFIINNNIVCINDISQYNFILNNYIIFYNYFNLPFLININNAFNIKLLIKVKIYSLKDIFYFDILLLLFYYYYLFKFNLFYFYLSIPIYNIISDINIISRMINL